MTFQYAHHRPLTPITPVHSPHPSAGSSVRAKTPGQLSLHEYRKMQVTPSPPAIPGQKTVKKKRGLSSLSRSESTPASSPGASNPMSFASLSTPPLTPSLDAPVGLTSRSVAAVAQTSSRAYQAAVGSTYPEFSHLLSFDALAENSPPTSPTSPSLPSLSLTSRPLLSTSPYGPPTPQHHDEHARFALRELHHPLLGSQRGLAENWATDPKSVGEYTQASRRSPFDVESKREKRDQSDREQPRLYDELGRPPRGLDSRITSLHEDDLLGLGQLLQTRRPRRSSEDGSIGFATAAHTVRPRTVAETQRPRERHFNSIKRLPKPWLSDRKRPPPLTLHSNRSELYQSEGYSTSTSTLTLSKYPFPQPPRIFNAAQHYSPIRPPPVSEDIKEGLHSRDQSSPRLRFSGIDFDILNPRFSTERAGPDSPARARHWQALSVEDRFSLSRLISDYDDDDGDSQFEFDEMSQSGENPPRTGRTYDTLDEAVLSIRQGGPDSRGRTTDRSTSSSEQRARNQSFDHPTSNICDADRDDPPIPPSPPRSPTPPLPSRSPHRLERARYGARPTFNPEIEESGPSQTNRGQHDGAAFDLSDRVARLRRDAQHGLGTTNGYHTPNGDSQDGGQGPSNGNALSNGEAVDQHGVGSDDDTEEEEPSSSYPSGLEPFQYQGYESPRATGGSTVSRLIDNYAQRTAHGELSGSARDIGDYYPGRGPAIGTSARGGRVLEHGGATTEAGRPSAEERRQDEDVIVPAWDATPVGELTTPDAMDSVVESLTYQPTLSREESDYFDRYFELMEHAEMKWGIERRREYRDHLIRQGVTPARMDRDWERSRAEREHVRHQMRDLEESAALRSRYLEQDGGEPRSEPHDGAEVDLLSPNTTMPATLNGTAVAFAIAAGAASMIHYPGNGDANLATSPSAEEEAANPFDDPPEYGRSGPPPTAQLPDPSAQVPPLFIGSGEPIGESELPTYGSTGALLNPRDHSTTQPSGETSSGNAGPSDMVVEGRDHLSAPGVPRIWNSHSADGESPSQTSDEIAAAANDPYELEQPEAPEDDGDWETEPAQSPHHSALPGAYELQPMRSPTGWERDLEAGHRDLPGWYPSDQLTAEPHDDYDNGYMRPPGTTRPPRYHSRFGPDVPETDARFSPNSRQTRMSHVPGQTSMRSLLLARSNFEAPPSLTRRRVDHTTTDAFDLFLWVHYLFWFLGFPILIVGLGVYDRWVDNRPSERVRRLLRWGGVSVFVFVWLPVAVIIARYVGGNL